MYLESDFKVAQHLIAHDYNDFEMVAPHFDEPS